MTSGPVGTPLEVVVGWVLLLATLAEFALGIYVLHRSNGYLAARFLGARMLLQLFAFTVLVAPLQNSDPNAFAWELSLFGVTLFQSGIVASPFVLAYMLLGFVGPLLVAFALTFPTPVTALAGRRGWLLAPLFLPSLIVAAIAPAYRYGVLRPPLDAFALDAISPWWGSFSFLAKAVPLMLAIYALAAGIILLLRARLEEDGLRKRRLRFLVWWVAMPMTLASILWAAWLFALPRLIESQSVVLLVWGSWIVERVAYLGLLLIPAGATAVAVLRYRVLDFDGHVRTVARHTVSWGAIVSIAVVLWASAAYVFALVLPGPAAILLGGVIAAPLVSINPIRRPVLAAGARLVPEATVDQPTQAQRRQEFYRVNYEEIMQSRTTLNKARDELQALSQSIGLNEDERRQIERDDDQRGGAVNAGQ